MGGSRLSYPACVVAGKEKIVPEDVVFLRKYVFAEGLTGNDDVQALLGIHRAVTERCKEWDEWFVETMTAFIVHHAWPQGSLDEVNARWIIAVFAPKGVIEDPVELEFVVHAIEVSRAVPDFLSALAMDQVRLALTNGKGAYAAGRKAKRQGVADEDVGFLLRVLRGACNRGELIVTKREAHVLAAIEKKVEGHLNHPDWLNMLMVLRDKGIEETRSSSPWLRPAPDKPVFGTMVA